MHRAYTLGRIAPLAGGDKKESVEPQAITHASIISLIFANVPRPAPSKHAIPNAKLCAVCLLLYVKHCFTI
nr:MAG TPA: hypothetical protein [Bacteriophage sp.]